MNSEKNSHPDNEVLVRVEGVSKKFCRSLKKSLWYGLCDIGAELNPLSRKAEKLKLGNSENGSISASQNVSVSDFPPAARDEDLRDGEFYAVRDVSFELRRGECLGLIGHNGAGKTTLLKMLNGLIKPDAGRITMRGRVGALIALGAGFNPILTGRENIYINGSVLGLSRKEIDAKIDEIIDFAEIGEFIDTPVQNYSSGMNVRLGFAVATAMNPDILILDEVLAVGDAAFRNKCYNRIARLRNNAAFILVSHNMEQVGRACSTGLLMQRGVTRYRGDIEGAISAYENTTGSNSDGEAGFETCEWPVSEYSVFLNQDTISFGDCLNLEIALVTNEPIYRTTIKIVLYNAAGAWAAEASVKWDQSKPLLPARSHRIGLTVDSVPLRAGTYKLGVILIGENGAFLGWSYKAKSIAIRNSPTGTHAECLLHATMKSFASH